MSLALIIVNWNVRDLLAACLASVVADLERSGLRATSLVCVVDNASSDGSAALVRERFPQALLVEAPNRGMGAGNNLGMAAALARMNPDAFFILNPDTLVRPGALAALTAQLQQRPRAGVVAPKLLNPDGTLQHAGFRFPGLAQLAFDLFPLPGRLNRLMNSPLNGRYPVARYAQPAPFQVEHTLGAAFLVRRQAAEECGLFDEAFAMYCEEIDWQWRLAHAGWERWLVPQAEVVHYGGQSTGQASARSQQQLWSSRARLYQRYYPPATFFLARLLVGWGLRQRLRANRQIPATEQRAELNLALLEALRAWEGRRRVEIGD